MDFTLKSYLLLLHNMSSNQYQFQTFKDYISDPFIKCTVLRHDVDSWPFNALQMAELEAKQGIRASYYFRMSPLSLDQNAIRRIVGLGHEIGYHYEDLTTHRGNYEKAICSFQSNLDKLREFYPVTTIAMHGKPLSRWNNLDLWTRYDYQKFGLIGEPYLSLDFDQVLYLTDTGNCWDGNQYSIRDEVKSKYSFNIHTTGDLIDHLNKGLLPDQIMLNIHPSRWNDSIIKWVVRYCFLTLPKYLPKKWLKEYRSKKNNAI